ncbi:Anaphase-promoting complex subunit 1 [Toxocara canis]|uniref:Anaphase-promoting complex subunit 1 n=1 Tax=Toxocara canis TaxID=6265 RepID=A0A0B2VXL6_TOXCA|nr:Anaphase-promoting complex subunit 1 [Toxocara canis]
MLEVVKDTVTVTSIPGGILQYAVTANFHLVDAFWCDFPAGNPAATDDDLFGSCICLIGKQVIQFCPREGSQIYAITLPFPVSKVLPSPLGLIMEKERTPKSASSCVMFPHLFSLSHPYNELLPIVCRNKDDERSCHYALDPLELEAVNTLEECGMLLCYSRRSRAHSLHVMREVTKEEWKCAAAKTESLITRSTKGTPAELSGEQSIVCSSLFTTPRSRPRIGGLQL